METKVISCKNIFIRVFIIVLFIVVKLNEGLELGK